MMNSLYLDLDQGIKQEQYKDLLREARHYRLVKAIAQSGPKGLREVAVALRKAMDGLAQHLPSLRPANRARI
jgi:predicted transcriptional regulator